MQGTKSNVYISTVPKCWDSPNGCWTRRCEAPQRIVGIKVISPQSRIDSTASIKLALEPGHVLFELLPDIRQNGQDNSVGKQNEWETLSFHQMCPPLAALHLPQHTEHLEFCGYFRFSTESKYTPAFAAEFSAPLLRALEWTLREPCMTLSPQHLLLEQRLAQLIHYALKIPLSRIITAGWALLEDNLCSGYLLVRCFPARDFIWLHSSIRQCNLVLRVHGRSEPR